MTTPAQNRFHALDATRALALLLGVVLHATMSFFLPIPAQDHSPSTTLAVLFFVIHSFRMCLFFLIAGFFARLLFHRLGARAFAKDRARRILVPMTVGWLLLAPAILAILIVGFERSFPDGLPAGIEAATSVPQGFPLTHLWFLYYLCVFYVLALVVRSSVLALLDRNGHMRARLDLVVRVVVSHQLAPLALALPLFMLFQFSADWPLWFGIATPDHGLLPQWQALIGFGTAFGFGWLAQRQTQLLEVWRRQWFAHLIIATALSALCIALIGTTPSANAVVIEGPAWHRPLYALSYTMSIWYWVFGIIGAAQRFCANASSRRRYLADASYWVYVIHLPVVFGLQVLVMDWPLHWTLKFGLIIAATMAVALTSYHYLVRASFIGEILNGRRYPRRLDDATTPHAEVIADEAAVAQFVGVSKRHGAVIAIDDLDFSVQRGELLALLGPNGAGKSTAIGLWLGIVQADQGVVRIMGGAPTDVHSRLDVGVMLQDVELAPMLTAREHIALASSAYRQPLSIDDTIARVGIATIADKRYGTLSGGQKRQVQFAVAVCGRPKLLFLDEPTTGLDVRARELLWQVIRRLRDDGCSIILTTHYLEEAEALADRVAVLAKGRLIADGSVDEMRALVTRKRIRCVSTLDVDEIKRWPGVIDATRGSRLLQVTATDAESVVRRLLATDAALSQLEVAQASLADALNELTQEAA